MRRVLDYGYVRLVSYMQPAEPVIEVSDRTRLNPGWSGDLEVVRNARVSYDAEWRTGDDAGKDEKLIKYLYNNKHSSPFEAMVFTFEVKAPIFVIRQWQRHRTWSYSEVSARYTELPEEFYVPDALYKQGEGNKQMSSEEKVENERNCIGTMSAYMKAAHDIYHNLMKQGVSRELARSVLPLGTYTRMFATCDLHNLLHFIRLRLHPHTQKEIQVYAQALLDLIEPICPAAVLAFKEQK